jgi:hypothetical protein
MAACWILCFGYVGYLFGSAWLSVGAYAGCFALVYLVIVRLHLRAAKSPSMRDAQRKLRLLPAQTALVVVNRRLHSLTLACGWHRIVDPTVSMGVQLAYGQGGTNSASHHLGRDSGPRCSCLLEVSRACPRGLAKRTLRTQADRFLAARVSRAYSASSSC